MSKRVIKYIRKNRADLLILFFSSVIVFVGIVITFGPYANVSFGNVGSMSVGVYGFFIIFAGAFILLINLWYKVFDEKTNEKWNGPLACCLGLFNVWYKSSIVNVKNELHLKSYESG